MGVRISVHNDTENEIPVRGNVRLLGGAKLHGWSFTIGPHEIFTKMDAGIAAGSHYNLELFVSPKGSTNVVRYLKGFQAPHARHTLDLYVSDVMETGKAYKSGALDVEVFDNVALPGNPPKFYDENEIDHANVDEVTAAPFLQSLDRFFETINNPRFVRSVTGYIWPNDMSYGDIAKRFGIVFVSPFLLRFLSWPIWTLMKTLYQLFEYLIRFVFINILRAPIIWASGWLVHIALILIFITFLPRIIGWLLTTILYYTAMNGYPLSFQSVHLQPWMNDLSTLHLHIKTENVKFGNPPKNFAEIPNFIECKWLDFHVKISLENILGLCKFGQCNWSPFPSDYSKISSRGGGGLSLTLSCENLPENRPHYVVVRHAGRKRHKTQSVSSTSDPEWPLFTLPFSKLDSHANAPLICQIYERMSIRNDRLVGTCKFDLDELRSCIETDAKDTVKSEVLDKYGKTVFGKTIEVNGDKKIKWRKRTHRQYQDPAIMTAKVGNSKSLEKYETNSRTTSQTYCSCVDFTSIDFRGVVINFAYLNGVFNINDFTREIAKGECKNHVESVLGEGRWPNTLLVRVLRCRNLVTRGTHPPNVRVRIHARTQKAISRLHAGNQCPIIDEAFELKVKDPSTVLHVEVIDEGIGSKVIGQWIFTMKWFYLSPFFNHHNSMVVEKDLKTKNGKPCGWIIKGWFPLLGDSLDIGGNGEIELWLQWTYKEKNESWKPPKLTALQQLTENSGETTLRLGNVHNVMRMLKRFPILLNVGRVTIRDIEFYLKDLFAGEAKDVAKRAAIKIPVIEVKNFKPKFGAVGLPLVEFLKRFFLGVVPKIQGGTLGSAAIQITGGVFSGFGGLFASYKTDVAKNTKEGLFHLNIGTVFSRPLKQTLVTAFDHDYWKPVKMEGYLDIKSKGKWHLYKAELKANTLFFWRTDGKTKKDVVRKVDLSMATNFQIIKKGNHALKITSYDQSTVHIRIPTKVSRPTLVDWERRMRIYRARHLKKVVLFYLISADGLPAMDLDGSCDPYCIIELKNKFGNIVAYTQQTPIRNGRNVKFNTAHYIWPLDATAHTLEVSVYDHDILSSDDWIGSVKLNVSEITSDDQIHTLKLQDAKGTEGDSLGSLTFKASIVNDAKIVGGQITGTNFRKKQKKFNLDLKSIEGVIENEGTRFSDDTPDQGKGDMYRSQYSDSTRENTRKSAIEIGLPQMVSSHDLEPPNNLPEEEVSAKAPPILSAAQAPDVFRKIDKIERLIISDRIMRLLDTDHSSNLDEDEVKPLMDLPDEELTGAINKYFHKSGLSPTIRAETVKKLSVKTLAKLLGDRVEYVHDFLVKSQKNKAELKYSKEKKNPENKSETPIVSAPKMNITPTSKASNPLERKTRFVPALELEEELNVDPNIHSPVNSFDSPGDVKSREYSLSPEPLSVRSQPEKSVRADTLLLGEQSEEKYCAWLWKKMEGSEHFEKRYFKLDSHVLSFFEDDKAQSPLGTIGLLGSVITPPEVKDPLVFQIHNDNQTVILKGNTEEAVGTWMDCIKAQQKKTLRLTLYLLQKHRRIQSLPLRASTLDSDSKLGKNKTSTIGVDPKTQDRKSMD